MAAEISVRASAMEGASMRDLATPPLESSSVMGAKPREESEEGMEPRPP